MEVFNLYLKLIWDINLCATLHQGLVFSSVVGLHLVQCKTRRAFFLKINLQTTELFSQCI